MTVQGLSSTWPVEYTGWAVLFVVSAALGASIEAVRRLRRSILAKNKSLKDEIEGGRRAHEALRELSRQAEQQHRILTTTLACIKDFAYVFGEGGCILFANQPLLDLWGLTIEQVIGKNLFELGYPDDLAVKLHRQVQKVFETRQSITGETHYTSPSSGLMGYYEHIFAPAFAADGTMDFVVGSTRDISARKLAQDALRHSEEMLRMITNLVPHGIFAKDSAGRHIFVNTALAKMARLSAEEMLGKDDFDLVADRAQAELYREHDRIVTQSGTIMTIPEEPRTDLSGRTRYLQTIKLPFTMAESGAPGVLGVCTDITEQRQMKKLLEESEGRYRALVEWSPESISVQRGGKIIYANPAAIRMLGAMSEEDLVGRSSLDLVHPDFRDRARRRLSSISERDSVIPMTEETLVKLDGTTIEVELQGKSIIYDGEPALYGSMRDITERKRLERELRLTQFAVEHASDAVFWVDPHGRFIYVNQASCRSLGYSREEFLSLSVSDVDPLVPQEAWEPIWEDLKKRCSVTFETQNRTKQGRIFPVEVTANYMQFDGGEYNFSFVRDITERKRLEATLQESEEKFRTMANSIPQLAWIARADGYIFWFNQRWYEYTGTTLEQVEGWGWQSVYDPRVIMTVIEKWQGAINAGKPFEMEFPLRGADGRLRTFLTRVQPLKDAAGRVLQWFGTNTDVEQLKQAEEKIQRANNELEHRVMMRTAELQAANKELEAFSYSVSHDLRAPLRAVNGFARIVMDRFGSQVPADALEYLERVCNGAKRMGELIDDLLRFSNLGRQPMLLRDVDSVKLVQDVLHESAPQWEGRQIDIRVGKLPACHGDVALLRQVWVNLISNAIKYTGRREAAVIEIGCERKSKENVFFVRDNGTGFNMQYAKKLFGVFQRLHLSEEFEGTGVGLAIVQRIVHRHGGRVWAEAVEGQGATFYFSIKGEEKHA
jgi:PAS domain S-box-containing protein